MEWSKHVAESILPRSREKTNLRNALQEWRYTGNVTDLERPIETCQLCGHPDIRYQFEIQNRHTNAHLLIGSECIKRFDISAIDETGNVLDRAATHAKVGRDRQKLIDDARERRMMKSLIRLAHIETDVNIDSFIGYYREKRGAFTPKQLLYLFDLMMKHEIDFQKEDFKMVIKRGREKDQLAAMEPCDIEQLWECMSVGQRKWYDETCRNDALERQEKRHQRLDQMIKEHNL
jgi:hypothetical protein